MAENEQSGFHEGVTIPAKRVGAESSIHTDVTVVMPRGGGGASGVPLPTGLQGRGAEAWSTALRARHFGDYDMVEAIAKGGMGEIHLAKDGELEREVAVKVSTVSEGAVDPRFTKEARVLANLAHPNIVPIYNLGVDSAGRPFYSMKLVKGRTLQSVLNAVREGEDAAVAEFTRAKLLTIFRKVCDAMAFAHSKGVLHRDLKPENVMVGEYGEVLVMDWGLAKVIGVEEELKVGVMTRTVSGGLSGDFGVTMEGEVMGTPQYMSPEQAEGVVAGLDERSDVYALGAILYAVLTYKPPIDGKTLEEVLGNVKRGSLSPMATATRMTKGIGGCPEPMPVEVPEALRAVVLKAMARERERRYASVEELGADLDAYVGGFATRAEGAGVFRQVRLFVHRHRAVSGAVALFLLSLVTFLVKLAASERTARLYARTAEEQRAVAERQAEVALANEKAANEQKESARRSAARARIALAEACESLEDGAGVVDALSGLDDDLKTQPSKYLESRMDESILTHRFDKPTHLVLAHPKNGNEFVIVQANGWVRSLDVLSGQVSDLFRIGIHGSNHCALSQDGKQFAWLEGGGSAGWSLNLWSVAAGEQSLKVPDAISGPNIFGIAFSPDGKRIMVNASAASNRSGGHLRVWDAATGKLVWARENTGHLNAEYSADGSRVCVLSERDGMLDLNSATGEVDRVINATAKLSQGALIGQSWASVSRNSGRVSVLSREDGSIRHMDRLTGLGAQVVAVGKNHVAVFTERWDSSLMIKMLAENGEERDPLFYVGKVYDNPRLVGHPLSGLVALKNGDELKVWRLRNSDALKLIPANWDRQNRVESYIRFQKFSGNQLFRARTHPEGFLMELFDEKDPLGERAPVARLAAPQASSLGSLSGVPGLAVWKSVTSPKSAMSVFEISRSGIKPLRDIVSSFELLDCSISPDGRQVFGGHGILEAHTGKELVRMERDNVGKHYESLWAPKNRIVELVRLGGDGQEEDELTSAKGLILWSGVDGKRLKEVPARYAVSLAMSPDGRRFLEGGSDGKVRIRSVETLEIEDEFRVENRPVVLVAWHPTLPLFITKTSDRGRVWDMRGVKQWESGRDLGGGGVMFSGDGKMLIFYRATEATTYAPEPFSQTKGK